MNVLVRHLVAAVVLCFSASSVWAKVVVKVEVFPARIMLETAADYQSFVVVATHDDGTTQDVTAQAETAVGDPAKARLEKNVLHPVADGATQLTVGYGDRKLTVPVTVQDAARGRPISFRLDVMPVFMKAGCNAGSCHGSARGQDGFHLSLFGYDPEGDYFRITREMGSRRLNLAVPAASLMMEKSLGLVPHSGGKRLEPDSEYARTLLTWLEAGAPNDSQDVAAPTALEILPRQMVLEGEGATQQMTVRATYSDGTDRDVTALAVFLSSNDNSAAVSETGLVTAAHRGEAFVMARFATFTVGSQVIVIPADLQYTRPALPENNYIDTLVNEKLHKLRIIPSELCSDEEFLRRVFIDITGTLPTSEDYRRFMADKNPAKRAALVDELLDRKEFAEMWVMKWAELLQMRTNDANGVSYKAMLSYFNWLQDRLAQNVPFDDIVQELLGASGGTFTHPATNFYQIERDTLKVAENVAQVFMGMRIQCAQCHNHPFDRWTMDDYYGFSAFFSQIGRKQAEDPRETIVFNSGSGEVKHPVDQRTMAPKFLGGAAPPEVAGEDRRTLLAQWIASKDNPYFARNLANIVWAHFLGQGIIEPVDDVRVSNPPSNPQLLDELARRLVEYDYDFKRFVRDICLSRTYQLSTRANDSNETDTRNFTRAAIRRLRAEVLLDAISQVTQTQNKFPGLPLGARAVQIADGGVTDYFLTTFGRATRETVCSCEVRMEPNLSQALHLINGEATHQRMTEGGAVKKMLEAGSEPRQVIEDLYLRCLSRPPSRREMDAFMAELAAEPEHPQKVVEDIFWALLNSKEFLFNR